MIIDKFQQEEYKFPAITYEKNINGGNQIKLLFRQ